MVSSSIDRETPTTSVSLRPERRFDRTDWFLPAGAGVVGALLFLLVKNSLTDDAYITLSYARNLAVHGEWGLVPDAVANSATSPLNVLLLAAFTFITQIVGEAHPVVALGIVTVLSTAVLGWGWMRLTRSLPLPKFVAVLGFLAVALNPFVLSAIGLEVLLIPAALILLVVFAVERKPILFGVVAGLAILIRLDLVLFVLIIAFSTTAVRRKLWHAVLSAVAVAGPWYVFSWFAFGSAIPDTLVIKQLQGGLFAPWSYFSGPVMYFLGRKLIVLIAFSLFVIGFSVLVGWAVARFSAKWKQFPELAPIAALGFGGFAYYGVYSVMGVGPYHWYYVAPIVAVSMATIAILGVWFVWAHNHAALNIRVPAVALGLVGALVLATGIADVKQGVPWKAPLIFGNWASADDYARVGKELGERLNGASVQSPGEIGTLAYFCECTILDEFSDRGHVVHKVEQRIAEAGAITGFALRVNYFWFDRSIQPKKVDYRLLYDSGPGTGPDTWTVNSAAKGIGHFTLVPAS